MTRGLFIVAGCETINGRVSYNNIAVESPANKANLLDANGIPLLGYQYQIDILKNNENNAKAQVVLHLKDDHGKILPKPYILNLELNKNTRLKIPGTNQWLICGLGDFDFEGNSLTAEVSKVVMDKINQITGLKLICVRGHDLNNPEDQPGGND